MCVRAYVFAIITACQCVCVCVGEWPSGAVPFSPGLNLYCGPGLFICWSDVAVYEKESREREREINMELLLPLPRDCAMRTRDRRRGRHACLRSTSTCSPLLCIKLHFMAVFTRVTSSDCADLAGRDMASA